MKNKETINRNYGLDILRILAVILVLTVHFFLNTNYYDTPSTGISMNIQSIIRNFCMSCVPLFLILTGFLNNKKEYNKSYYKGLLSIIIIWIFYSVIEFYVLGFINNKHSNFNFSTLLYNLTSFHACSYSWYIEMYLGLYLITPVINNAYETFNSKNKKTLVILSIIIGILPAFINVIFKNIIHFPDYWQGLYPLTYYIIGKYIADTKPNVKKKTLLILLAFTQVFTFSFSYISDIDYISLPIFIQTILLFLLLYNVNVKKDLSKKVLKYISSISLDIYLASSLIDKIVYPLFSNYYHFNSIGQQRVILYAPIIIVIVFVISTIYGSIRKALINVR